MSSLACSHRGATRPSSPAGTAMVRAAVALAGTVLGWPMRVHANRKLLNQMAGMSAHELSDIGLTTADLHDTAALPLGTEVGQFLATRVLARRRAWNGRWM